MTSLFKSRTVEINAVCGRWHRRSLKPFFIILMPLNWLKINVWEAISEAFQVFLKTSLRHFVVRIRPRQANLFQMFALCNEECQTNNMFFDVFRDEILEQWKMSGQYLHASIITKTMVNVDFPQLAAGCEARQHWKRDNPRTAAMKNYFFEATADWSV